jgi:antitoxin component YwqK of YwqJK toxin-antitoxin module
MKKLLLLLFSILISFNSFGAVNYTCADLQKQAKKAKLTNAFGRESKILQIKNSYELSRTNDTLVCIGDVKLSTESFDSDIKLRMEFLIDDGDGFFRYEVERNFVDDGKRKTYYSSGNLKSESQYIDDKLDGIQTQWHENGEKQREENYKNGKLDGKQFIYFKNGQVSNEQNYLNGVLDQETKYEYHSDGSLKSKANFHDNKITGNAWKWFSNGQMQVEAPFINGVPNGKMREWYENGQLKAELNYKEGNFDGNSTSWNSDGSIKREKLYKDGECISGDC